MERIARDAEFHACKQQGPLWTELDNEIKQKFGGITLSLLANAFVLASKGRGDAFMEKLRVHKVGLDNRHLVKKFFK